MSDRKDILRNTGYQIAGKVLTSAFGLLTTIVLTRYLGVQGFGQYSLIFAYISLVFVAANFGLDALGTRGLASKQLAHKDIIEIASIRGVLSVAVMLIAVGISYMLPYSTMLRAGILIGSLGYVFLLTANALWTFFRARLAFNYLVIADVSGVIVAFILIVGGVMARLPLLYFVAASSMGYVATYIVTAALIQSPIRFVFRPQRAVQILRESFPLALTVMLTVAFSRIDIMILSYYFNPDTAPDIGYYALSMRIFGVVIIFGSYYTSTLFPYFSRRTAESVKEFGPALKLTGLIAIASSVGLYILSTLLVRVAGGSDFLPAVPALKILSATTGLTILTGFLNTYLIAYGFERVWLRIAGSGLILSIVLNIILIPTYSFIGASWVSVAAQGWILLGSGYVVLQSYRNSRT